MAKKDLAVGVKIDGSAKGFKSAAEEAKKATAALRKKAEMESREMEKQFKKVTMALAKIGGAVLVAQKAFQVYGKVMQSTNTASDNFAITQEKIKFASNEVARSIVSMDFSKLAERMREASKAGKEFAIQMDEIFDLGLRISLVESKAGVDMARQELIFRNRSNPYDKRKEAAQEYLRIVENLEKQQIAFAQEELKAALLQSGVVKSGISEDRLRYLIDNADLIKMLRKEIELYVDATSEAGERAIFSGVGATPAKIKEWVDIRKTASDTVKDLAKDYEAYGMVLDPERSALTSAWVKFDNVMQKALTDQMKPLRSIKGLLDDQLDTLEQISSVATGGKLSGATMGGTRVSNLSAGISTGNAYTDPSNMNDMLMRQAALVDDLNGAFESMFSNVGEGFKGMADAMIQSIKRVVVELLAKAAVLTLLNLIFPGSGAATKAGSGFFKQFGFLPNMIGAGGPAKGAGIGSQSLNINVSGKIGARDINLANNRYNSLVGGST